MLVCFFLAQTFVIPIYKGNNRNYQKARVKCPPTAYQHHHGWTDSPLCKFLSDLCDLLAKGGKLERFSEKHLLKCAGIESEVKKKHLHLIKEAKSIIY